MVTDPIADFLTRIRNAIHRNKKTVEVNYTKEVEEIIKVLKEKTIIAGYEVVDLAREKSEKKRKPGMQKLINIELAYDMERGSEVCRITGVKRESKPGVRRYVGYKDIPRVRSGFGVAILSTPKGVMTGKDARKQKLGGELLCSIW